MDPMSSLIGSLLLGMGIMLVYGAIKNRRVFGKDGIVTTAIAQGSIASISEIPEAFSKSDTPVGGEVGRDAPPRGNRGPEETRVAITAIGVVDQSLANNVGAQLELVDAASTRADLMPLAQLLAIADAGGLSVSAATIRAYVKEVTDETI